MLPMANRIAWLGGGTAALVTLSLCAIVQQALLHPQPRQRTAAAPVPAAVRKTPLRTRQPVAVIRLETSVRTVLRRAVLARNTFGTQALGQPHVVLSRIDRAQGWAFGSSAVQPAAGAAELPYASLFIARQTGASWQVALAGARNFPSLLGKAPASVVPRAELPILRKYGATAPPANATATGLMLPWQTGQSWTLEPPQGSVGLRFSGGDGRALAPGDGRLYQVCGMVLLIHPNGLASEFSQLTGGPSVKDGSLVRQGTFLGKASAATSCGQPGSATLGFALLSAGHPLPVDGVQIGGWTLHAPSGAPLFADRAGLRVNAGNPLLNFGTAPAPAAPPAPSSSPSPSVSPSPSSSLLSSPSSANSAGPR